MDLLDVLCAAVTEANDFYVYGYLDPVTLEPFYVGKGRGDRMYAHLYECNLKKRDYFHNKLRGMLARGIQPIVEKIQDRMTESEALCYEECLILIYGRRDIGTGILCNHTFGGEGVSGYRHTEESLQKLRLKGYRQKEVSLDTRVKLAFAGKTKRSKETIEKRVKAIRASRGYRVESYDLKTGQTIKTYETIRLVERDGFQRANVTHCCNGRQKQHQGLGWRRI